MQLFFRQQRNEITKTLFPGKELRMSLEEITACLRSHVQTLALTPRPPATPEHRRAREYIQEHLQNAGFEVELRSYKTSDEGECLNLLTKPFPDNKALPLVVIGAHYDTMPDSPGADDNASAVAGLLELARWIGPHLQKADDLKACLQLVAYDLEEYGLVGSQIHCAEIGKSNQPLKGMVSLEMLGFTDHRPGSQQLPPAVAHLYPDVGNFIGVVGNQNSTQLLEPVVREMKAVEELPVEYISVPGNGELLPATRLSDHASFWEAGFPALMITDTSFYRNPHYHQTTDTPDTLDYPFLARVTQGVCRAVWELLH